MFPTFISISRCLYYATIFSYENRDMIFNAYSLFDTTKFAFFVSEKIGVVDLIKKKITPETYTVVLEISGVEKSDVGDFEIIS